MKNEKEVELVQEKLHKLIEIVTDPNLWNFLTDKERQQVSEILQQV